MDDTRLVTTNPLPPGNSRQLFSLWRLLELQRHVPSLEFGFRAAVAEGYLRHNPRVTWHNACARNPERAYGYAEGCISWELCLHSKKKRLRLGKEIEEASFAISLHPPLGAKDWRRLRGSPVKLSPECLACSFYFHFGCYGEWEDLLSLDLGFGEGRAGRVEIWANGSGGVEAAPDLFPDGQVEFQIHTWATSSLHWT